MNSRLKLIERKRKLKRRSS